jgi:hypothetical protein
MKLPPETISPYLIPQSNQESFTTSASTNSGHSVHQTNVGEVARTGLMHRSKTQTR